MQKTAHDVYGLVLQLVTKATPTLSESYLQAHPETPQHERSATPFWKLVFLFEALIFQPQASATKLKKNVTRRLKLFAAGHIKELYEEMLQRPRSKPSTVACQADIDEWNELTFQPVEEATFHQHNPNAQRAANRDNLQTAFRSTDRSLPVAMNTDATIQAIQQKLYPPPVADCPHQQEPTRRLASMPRRRLLPKDTDLIAALKHIKTGTAPGPFADSTDLIRSFALEVQHLNDPDKEAVYPNLRKFREFLDILDMACIPDDIIPYFSSQYFLALHKDVDDDAKLRPIGIGTHVRRILGAMETNAYSADFAAVLWPFQFGIAIPGGMELLTHTIQGLLYKFLPGSPAPSSASRALLQLDIVNMFNATSRLDCKAELDKDMPELVPIFDLLYHKPNVVWYQCPDGSWDSFLHREGFTQGCPLSVLFACKVLHPVLVALKAELDQRAQERLSHGDAGDNQHGSKMAIGAYLDDTTLVIPLCDISFALEHFATHGRPRGLILNMDKTKLLTTLDPQILPDDNTQLQPALTLLRSANCLTRGTVLLGTPLGSPTFVHESLLSAADTFAARCKALENQVDDLQTKVSLFRNCLQATVPHLLAADVALRTPSALHPVDPFAWTSPFLDHLNTTTACFLAHISGHSVNKFDPGSAQWILAHSLISLGGLGFQDYAARAAASFVVPLARSIRYATLGIQPKRSRDTMLHLDPSLAVGLQDWQTSPSPTMSTFRFLATPLLASQRLRNIDDIVTHLVGHLDLQTLTRDLVRTFKRTQLTTFMATAPEYMRPHLPMLLNRHTSEALLCMSRRCRDHRLPTPYFRLMFCRKLRLEIYSGSRSSCPCGKLLDTYGDHFFTCQRFHSKTTAHNMIRDALHLILTEIGTHAGLITNRAQVRREQLNLVHCYPTSRPGDLCVECCPTYVSPPLLPFAKAAVDVRVTGSFYPPSGGDSSYTVSVTKHHQVAEREKLCGPNVNTASSYVNGEMIIRALTDSGTLLVPFIVDPFGGLGPIANRFLFGLRPNPAPTPLTFGSPTSQTAHDNVTSTAAPSGLTRRADRQWKQHCPHLPFGRTYHAWFPSTWTRQVLGGTINLAFAQHLYTSIRRDYTPNPTRTSNRLHPYPSAVGRASRFVPANYLELDYCADDDFMSTSQRDR